ncbi:MAG: hypothetical protein JWM99_207 [Verrucomicrobiales bacterium]|jgi:hypothetical protein|nr:hypothetical protein [Verrucomicrobiales bacterium]
MLDLYLMKKASVIAFSLMFWALAINAADSKPLYQNDFEKAEIGKVPDDFLVLDGGFAVREEGGNKFLELPGAPLDSFGVLFGPTEKENLGVSARIFGTAKGRRMPTFAVALGGIGGYKLQVSPAKKAIELYKGDTLKKSVEYDWKSGQWTTLHLQVVKAKEGEWKVQGKAWSEGAASPAHWNIELNESEQPPAGRPAILGSPYATTPIRYDDLKVTQTGI